MQQGETERDAEAKSKQYTTQRSSMNKHITRASSFPESKDEEEVCKKKCVQKQENAFVIKCQSFLHDSAPLPVRVHLVPFVISFLHAAEYFSC